METWGLETWGQAPWKPGGNLGTWKPGETWGQEDGNLGTGKPGDRHLVFSHFLIFFLWPAAGQRSQLTIECYFQ